MHSVTDDFPLLKYFECCIIIYPLPKIEGLPTRDSIDLYKTLVDRFNSQAAHLSTRLAVKISVKDSRELGMSDPCSLGRSVDNIRLHHNLFTGKKLLFFPHS